MELRSRVGIFFYYCATISLLVFAASMANQQPDLPYFLCGASLVLIGFWVRRGRRGAPELPQAAPKALPIMNAAQPRRSLFRLPGRKKNPAPPP